MTAGSTEINIAYGNNLAAKSDYENGTKVFLAFDDFETDLSRWEFTNPNAWSLSSSATVFGQYGLAHNGDDQWAKYIGKINVTSLQIQAFCSKNEKGNYVGIALYSYWSEATRSGYTFVFRHNQEDSDPNEIYLIRVDNGTTTGLVHKQLSDLYPNTPYKLVLIKRGNILTGKIYDKSGNLIGSVNTSDATYSNIVGVGFAVHSVASYHDNFIATSLSDPADFGTPQLVSR